MRDGYDGWMRSRPTEENLPAGQLAKIGLTPADVTHVVVTHTHFDHAGGLGDFPGAIHVIQKSERELPAPVYPIAVPPSCATSSVSPRRPST